MTEKLIIGCPYTGMMNLYQAFRELGANEGHIFNFKDVSKLDRNNIWVDGNAYEIAEFRKSFIRYPYDLIPPHSATYSLREETEYLKSVALLLDHVAINPLASTWVLRNRAFSLKEISSLGAKIPDFVLTNSPLGLTGDAAIKAIGNCFVSENQDEIPSEGKQFCVVEEDDGDFAVIFPASLFDAGNAGKYIDCFGHAFLQEPIDSLREFRGYLIGNEVFMYMRDQIVSFDKSAAKYIKTDHSLSNSTAKAFKRIMKKYNLGFLCFDIVVNDFEEEYVIDVNPYGSMPKFKEHPQPSLALAKLLLD